jgi:hypothetical protein
MKPLFTAIVVVFAVALSLAAPAAKEKVAPLGPPTEEQFKTAKNNLLQIALAWHNYNDTNNRLPSNVETKDGKPLLSWRVQILPYIEQDALYKQFKLDEPWDSANNKQLIEKIPAIYAPIRVKADRGMTFYQAFTGKNGLLQGKYTIATIPDGTSNTLMCVEADKPVIWTKPDDLVFDGKDVPALGGHFDGKWYGVMCDGAVYRFKKDVKPANFSAMIDPADGVRIDLDDAVDPEEKK